MQVGVLFADIRGFTAFSEKSSSAAAADGLSRFYAVANRVLTRDDALVEFVGDQVMALYLPAFPSLGERTPEVMLSAAERLVAAIDGDTSDGSFRIGVGLHMGIASVGNVNKGNAKDFTAVGDVVNTAARLQSQALAGQIVASEAVYQQAADGYPDARPVSFSVKGKTEPVRAYVIGGVHESIP
jgi:adenylate cyclase